MESGSFSAGYRGIDDAPDPDALLSYLDGAAAIGLVRDAKQRATDALRLGAGDRVLDVGCGTGVDAPRMLGAIQPGGTFVGLDFSARAIDAAAGRLGDRDDVHLVVGDAHRLPFEGDAFDALRVDRTMLHLADPGQALTEFRRVMAPGARLAVLEMGARLEGESPVLTAPEHAAVAGQFWRRHETLAPITLFLPLLLAREGFVDVEITRASGVSHEFEAADKLTRVRLGAAEAVGAGVLAEADARHWLEAIQAAMTAGDAHLVWESMQFAARVPG